MCMRALLALDWRHFTDAQLQEILRLEQEYDELIFVISRPEGLLEGHSPMLCSQLMPALQTMLQLHLRKPFYLLPIPGKGLPDHYHWLRWRILCPAFTHAFTSNAAESNAMELTLRVPVTVIPPGGAPVVMPALATVKRGIFITRAQPFHNGHAAYLEQMKAAVDEAIVIVGVANRSHTAKDFATAGERLEMIKPYLDRYWPGRHYLAALPYSGFSLENFYELEYVLPAFHTVYTINTSTITYAHTAGYPVKNLNTSMEVSGTQVRACMVQDQPYDHLVPESVHRYLTHINLATRLKQLLEKENR